MRYLFGPEVLLSTLDLAPLPEQDGHSTGKQPISISLGPSPQAGASHCRMELENGDEAWVGPRCDQVQLVRRAYSADSFLRRELLDHLLPRLLDGRGHLVLHGAGVDCDGAAIILLGASGSGKSTLGAGLHLRGMQLLGDDGLVIQQDEGPPTVMPTYRSLRLWGKSLAALFPGDEASIPLDTKATPGHWPTGQAMSPAIPVAGYFLLDRRNTGTPRVELLRPQEACMALISNAFQLDATAPLRAAGRIAQAARACESSPVYRLSYPREFGQIDRVRDTILNCLALAQGTRATGAEPVAAN